MITSNLRRPLVSSQLRIREIDPCCGPDIPAQHGVTGGGNYRGLFSRYGSVDIPLGWPLRYSHFESSVFEVGRQLILESFLVLVGISFDRRLLIFPEQTQDLSIDFIGVTTIPARPKGSTVRRP